MNPLALLTLVVIALATLTPRGGGGPSRMCAMCEERVVGDFLANILLFAPFGFALVFRGRRLVLAAVLGALVSLIVEGAQLTVIAGRDPNVGDFIANTLGALTGGIIARFRYAWLPRGGSLQRTLIVASITSMLLLGGLSLFAPTVPQADWMTVQFAPQRPDMAVYLADVHSVRIGDVSFDTTSVLRPPRGADEWLFGSALHIDADMDLPPRLAPIVEVRDDQDRELLMLGAARADLVYRQRMRADVLRLDRGDVRVHQAFEHVQAEEAYTLRWQIDREGYCLELNGRTTCGRGFTVGDTWSLLLALDWGTDERTVLGAFWLLILFVPAGLPALHLRYAAIGAALASAVLMTGALLLGFAAMPVVQIVAVWIGMLIGGRCGRRSKDAARAMVSGGHQQATA